MQPKSGLRKKRLPATFRWTTSTTQKRSTIRFFLGTSSSFNWTIRRTPGHRPQYLHSRSTSRKAKEDGSDFIMRRCWGSLMDTRCGNGSPISWEHSLQELHRFVRDSKGQRRRSKAPCDAGPRRFLRNRTRRVVHLRQITAAKRACFGQRGRKNLPARQPAE